MEKEEGEMSDDNMVVEDDPDPVPISENEDVKVYKAEKNGIVFETLEKIDAAKLEERAKRFGLNLIGHRIITQNQIDELYAKSGIESGNERHFRFDTLHLYGIEGLTTREIFEYLEDFKPVSLEKVDDMSCNIVCQDHIAAALALLVHSREIRSEELKKMLSEKSKHHWREGMPHPKNDLILMRFSTNSDKKVGKRKVQPKQPEEPLDQSMDPVSKNPWGDLCRSWGVYDHQEVDYLRSKLPKLDYEDSIEEEEIEAPVKIRNKKLAMRLGKRRKKPQESGESSDLDSQWKKKSKTPRMRMHADDEESKLNTRKLIKQEESDDDYDDQGSRSRPKQPHKDAFAPLSIEVDNLRSSYTPKATSKLSDKFKFHKSTDTVTPDRSHIQSRLGVKVVENRVDKSHSKTEHSLTIDESNSDDSDHYMMSRVQKVTNPKTVSSVWSRLDSNKGNESAHKDLRQMLKTKKKPSDDLRERISKTKKSNLRIEIDNL